MDFVFVFSTLKTYTTFTCNIVRGSFSHVVLYNIEMVCCVILNIYLLNGNNQLQNIINNIGHKPRFISNKMNRSISCVLRDKNLPFVKHFNTESFDVTVFCAFPRLIFTTVVLFRRAILRYSSRKTVQNSVIRICVLSAHDKSENN